MNSQFHNVCSCSISDIWRNYIVGTVPLVIVPIVPLFLGTEGLIFASLLGSLALFVFVQYERNKTIESCAMFPYFTARILLSFTVLVGIVVFVGLISKHTLGEALEIGLCLRTSLYLSLFSLILMKLRYLRVGTNTFCSDCLLRNGMLSERLHLGHYITEENKYLFRRRWVVFMLIFLLTVGFRCMETFHRFSLEMTHAVYVYAPLAIVTVDAILVRLRYYFIGKIRKQQDSRNLPYGGEYKLIRVLVFKGDRLLLSTSADGVDVPCSCYIPFNERISDDVARELASGVVSGEFSLKFGYRTIDPILKRGIEHYLCFVGDNNDVPQKVGDWVERTLLETDYSKTIVPLLQSELHRLYTVMQSSKKYTIDGKRKVDLDGYEPTITFEELETADANFNDNRWMLLSKFNDEQSFASLRKMWYKYIEGLNLK